ncbi:hypothetical protein AHF37_12041 [Paragonimus kellicotti]|nr:hypothetical protein AHF37_12041 [Paragonimus kellicotti]
MLKSILFFQDRYRSKETACMVDWIGSSNKKGPRTHPANPTSLVLHWLAGKHEYDLMAETFRHWNCSRRSVKLNLYGFEKYAQLISKVPVKHYAGISSMLKLMVPYIVPSEVTKVNIDSKKTGIFLRKLSPHAIFNYTDCSVSRLHFTHSVCI